MNDKFKSPVGIYILFSMIVSSGCSTTLIANTKGDYYVPGEGWVSANIEIKHPHSNRSFHFDWAEDSFWKRYGLREDVEAYTRVIAPYKEGEIVSAFIEHSSISGSGTKHGTCYFQLNMLLRIVNHFPSGKIINDRLVPLKSDAVHFRSKGPTCIPASQHISKALRRSFDLHALSV